MRAITYFPVTQISLRVIHVLPSWGKKNSKKQKQKTKQNKTKTWRLLVDQREILHVFPMHNPIQLFCVNYVDELLLYMLIGQNYFKKGIKYTYTLKSGGEASTKCKSNKFYFVICISHAFLCPTETADPVTKQTAILKDHADQRARQPAKATSICHSRDLF